MKPKKIIWELISILILFSITFMVGASDSRSQQKPFKSDPTPTPKIEDDIDPNRYAIAIYDASANENATDWEERRKKSQRYDGDDWIRRNPGPDTGGVGRFVERIPSPLIPSHDSDLILLGEIIRVNAFLSNDKGSVYSEFTLRIKSVLKNENTNLVKEGGSITFDLAGGYVRYPNGQKVLYHVSDQTLPWAGGEYVVFLTNDAKSSNYKLLTGYEIKNNNVTPLYTGRRFDELKDTKSREFLEKIANRIHRDSVEIDHQ